MKKIIIYLLIGAVVLLFGISAYKEATKSGAKAKRLPCHEKVTVFERLYLPNQIDDFKIENANLSASITLVPSVYQAPKLFKAIPKSEIESLVKKHLKAKLNESYPLHVKVMVVENDKLDPKKKNNDAKSFLGYIRASYYKNGDLIYQIQVDFLDKNEIKDTLQCIHQSLMSI
jgi:hypothetical protein